MDGLDQIPPQTPKTHVLKNITMVLILLNNASAYLVKSLFVLGDYTEEQRKEYRVSGLCKKIVNFPTLKKPVLKNITMVLILLNNASAHLVQGLLY